MDGAGERRGAIVGSACNSRHAADWQRFRVDEGARFLDTAFYWVVGVVTKIMCNFVGSLLDRWRENRFKKQKYYGKS